MSATPAKLTWEEVKVRLPIGSGVEGTVTAVPHYGVWFDLGVGFPGLMLAPEAGLGRGDMLENHYQPGQKVTAYVMWYNDVEQKLRLTLNQKFVTEQP